MIGDRHVFVVGAERVVRIAPSPAIGRMVDAGEEIGELADRGRQMQACIAPPGASSRAAMASALARSAPSAASRAETRLRNASRGAGPSAISGLRTGPTPPRPPSPPRPKAAPRRAPRRDRRSCRRSRPRRARAPPPGGVNTPSGRFWIGKSPWPLAEATQLCRFGSWVSSIPLIARTPQLPACCARDHPPIPQPKARRKSGRDQHRGSF